MAISAEQIAALEAALARIIEQRRASRNRSSPAEPTNKSPEAPASAVTPMPLSPHVGEPAAEQTPPSFPLPDDVPPTGLKEPPPPDFAPAPAPPPVRTVREKDVLPPQSVASAPRPKRDPFAIVRRFLRRLGIG